jgi:D-sedoheptulose 7-phosphate isomerase
MNFVVNFLEGINYIVKNLDIIKIKKFIYEIKKIKQKKGRIFFLGMGGSAGNCSHAVNDFRKLCEIECYTPTDNVSEFSARVNDEGLENTFKDWLKISHINKKDMIIIFSVGGGDKKRKISVNLINAI